MKKIYHAVTNTPNLAMCGQRTALTPDKRGLVGGHALTSQAYMITCAECRRLARPSWGEAKFGGRQKKKARP